MPVTPFPLHTFSGINLRDSVDSVGDQCIDCLNIDLDYSGTKVRSRDGYTGLTSVATTDAHGFLFRQNDSALLASTIVSGSTGKFQSINASGTITALANEQVFSAVNFGTPSATYTYYARATTGTLQTIGRLSGVTPTAPANMPNSSWLGVQETDNRLVVGGPTTGPSAAASSVHHVWFSDPGNAESWGANNYVQLTPGDGETIRAVVSWRGQVFVFKQTKMFVFYGNSTDASGNPVFNYRSVKLPSTVASAKYSTQNLGYGAMATAGEDGVYFVTNDGVYVTTGDVPALLTGDLYPLGTGQTLPSTYTGPNGRWYNALAIHFHKRRLFVSIEANTLTLVYDIDSGNWFPWSIQPSAFATWDGSQREGLLYFAGGTASHLIYSLKSTAATDDGAAITSYYRRGFNDLGTDTEKVIRETQLWGTGTVAYSTSQDFSALGTGRNVTLGTSPAIAAKYVQPSLGTGKGTVFSDEFRSVSGGPWAIHRTVLNVDGARSPGLKAP